jgi:PTS system mannose-specific IIA component
LIERRVFDIPVSDYSGGVHQNVDLSKFIDGVSDQSIHLRDVGDISHIVAVSIGWHDDVEAAQDQIERAIKNVSQGRGVIVLTDMFGGTPTNISAMFLKEGEVEIVTGVNLPMVIKLASNSKEISISDLAREIEDQGKQSIYRTGALLEPQLKKHA